MGFKDFFKRREKDVKGTLEYIHPRNLKYGYVYLERLVEGKLWLKIVIGMLLGLIVGLLLSPSIGWVEKGSGEIIGEWLALPGYFFLTMIQMIVVPLVLASVIRGIASSEDIEQLKTSGSRLLIFFLGTTVVAIIIGIAVGYIIEPGTFIETDIVERKVTLDMEEVDGNTFDLKTLPKDIIGVLPQNPLGAMLDNQMLQVVLFSFILGMALVSLAPAKAKPLLDILGSLQDVCMAIVQWLMLIAPLAVFGLLANVTIKTGLDALLGMGVYIGSVMIGFVVLLVFYLLLVFFLARRNPLTFMSHAREAQLLAFSTDSSAVTLPLTIKTAEEKMKVRPSLAQFVAPIGATVNMGGSALYQGLATIFMAQLFGIDLPLSALLALIVTVVGASIGTPATPGVGIVILSTVLTSAGIPLEGLALIIGVDRILEMFRTLLNVTGDLVACVVLERFSPDPEGYEREIEQQEAHEELREKSGEDVVVG